MIWKLPLMGLLVATLCQAAWVDADAGLETGVRLLEEGPTGLLLECTVAGFEQEELSINGALWSRLRLPGEAWLLEAGAPELPILARSVLIPDQGGVEMTVLSRETRSFEMQVAPSKGNLTRNMDPATVPWTFGPAYEAAVWPGRDAKLRDPYILRDFRGQTVVFQPFQVLPATGEVEVCTRMIVELSWTGEAGENELSRRSQPASVDAEFAGLYRERFLNYDSGNRYTPLEEAGSMLIISHDSFLDAMAPFVDWKTQCGMEVDLRPLSEVGSSPTAILNFVDDYYISPGLTYLLLVGDAEQLPSLSAAGGSSDPGFAFLQGNDYYPDIFVGRFSGSTVAHIETMVERCVEYERDTAPDADWLARATGIGSAEGSGIGDDGESDIQHQNNIRADLLGYTYTWVDQIYDPGASSSAVSAAVNEGRGFMNYTGHGSTTAWVTSGFGVTHINNLVNHNRLPFIVDVACVNGQFAGTTCFAEAWMRATDAGEPTGAVGIYASTINQSWAPPMAAQDECTDLLVAEAKLSFGGICFNGAMLMNDEYADYDMTRTWTIFTDPSLMLRSVEPAPLTVTHPGSVLSTAPGYTVQTGVEGARVSLYADGVLYGSCLSDGGGSAQLFMDQQPPVGATLVLTVLAHNCQTYLGEVAVIPPDGPYVALESCLPDGDGWLTPNESTWLTLEVGNLGVETAVDLSFALSCDHAGITSISGEPQLASLAAGATATLTQAFLLQTGALAEGELLPFTLLAQSAGVESWESSFVLTAHAPQLELEQILVLDDQNGRLDPGETAQISLSLRNTGSQTVTQMDALLSSPGGFVTMMDASDQIASLAPGALEELVFTIQVDPAATVGQVLNFLVAATALPMDLQLSFALTVGLVIEDFESGEFTSFPWEHAGSADWFVQSTNVQAGEYAAQSGNIGNNQSSTLQLTVDVLSAGDVSFWYKVSSEANYDYFRFLVDGSQVLQAAGTVGWTEATAALTAGEHTLSFTFDKDVSVSNGSDCAWIDELVFPALAAPASPMLVVTQESFDFFALPGQSDTTVLSVGNAGTAELEWSASFQETVATALQIESGRKAALLRDDEDQRPLWLSVSPASGTLDPGQSIELNLEADALFLEAGLHQGMILIESNDPVQAVLQLPVSFLVGGPAAPDELRIHYVGNCSSRLVWDPVPGADLYRIYQSYDSAEDWNLLAESEDTFWLLPCGTPGVHLYKVSAVTLP